MHGSMCYRTIDRLVTGIWYRAATADIAAIAAAMVAATVFIAKMYKSER